VGFVRSGASRSSTILIATAIALSLAFAGKLPCALDRNAPRVGLENLCYTDIVTLYVARSLGDTDLTNPLPAVEYAVGQALLMGVPARLAGSAEGFFLLTAALLSAAALLTAALLHRLVGRRALYFALAPTLVAYAFLNWDLVAVVLSVAAMTAYFSRRDAAAGAFVGLGAAVRIYPALFVVPLALGRLHEKDKRAAVVLVATSAATWLVLNVPFAVLEPSRWAFVYRFSGIRPTHWATLWYLGCHDPTWRFPCANTNIVNVLSIATFLVGAVLVWRIAARRGMPMWTLCFPLLALLLVTGKVYSPQYSLWLIPWFPLVLPRFRLFVAFVLTDLFAFAAETLWIQARLSPEGFPVGVLMAAVIARALVLLLCVITYLRTNPTEFARTAQQLAPTPRSEVVPRPTV
jgi:uncharacterized membrane protein